MKNKTILFPFVGDSVGGSQIATRVLITNLKKIGYRYEVLIFNDSGSLTNYLKKYNITFTVINNKTRNEYFNIFREFIYNFSYVRNFLKTNNICLVHTNDLRMHYLWSLYSITNKFQHIWHQHSAFYSRRNIFFSALSKKIITVSNYCKKSFTANMSKRAEVIGNPFEECDCKKKYKSKKKIVLYIGNSNLQKRARFFIDIAKDLNKKNRNIFFHILGDVPNEKNEILNLKKYNIKFFKKNYDTKKFLNESNLLVAPGINEGFGRTIVEAMLLKVPVVASNSGAHSEIIMNDKYGILAKPDNIHDFSMKILKSLTNYDKKKINLAFIYCKENFNIDVYLNKLKYLYDNLLR